MTVTVRAGNWARRYLGAEERRLYIAGEITAADAAVRAGIPREEVGMIAINGAAIGQEQPLRDGDAVFVYPVIIGG